MKCTIEFDLPEEQVEYELCMNGGKLNSILTDFMEWVRQLNKYQDVESISINMIRDKIGELFDDYEVTLL